MGSAMKRVIQTLVALTTATAVCSPAFAAGEKKDERFVLSSASVQTHRTDNTAAAIAAPVTTPDKKATVFAIGLEALKWVGATSRQVGVPYPDLWCADFVNFVLRRSGYPTTNSRAAKSFLDYGKRIDSPRVGAIVVLKRGANNGHV